MSASNPNSLAFIDGDIICSGHRDGNLRLWDIRSGKCTTQIAAHLDVTSVCVSRSKNFILTSGRDNVHNLFDVRTLEICGTFRAMGNRVVGSWGKPCISPDENCIAAGSSDGSVYIWSRLKNGTPTILEGHSSPVLASAWCGLGPLATSDRNHIYLWS
jgi:autophagy-related protein 16